MCEVTELTPSPFPQVGTLPDGWRRSKLDEVTERASGHTPNQGKPDYWNGGIKWVSLTDSAKLDRGYIKETAKEISMSGIRHSSAVLLPPDTVILSRDAGVGKSAILKSEMAVSQHFIAWSCRTKGVLDPWFLYLWMQMQKPFFERMAVGSTIKTIGLPLFTRVTIDFPPRSEQRKIAAILRTWDEAIERLGELRTKKEQRLWALRSNLIAHACRAGKLSSFGSFLTESRVPGSDGQSARKITVKLYGKGAQEKAENRVGSASTRYYRRSAGQIIYSKLDFLNGAFALIDKPLDGFESTLDLPAFDCGPEINSRWLIQYLIRPSYYTSQVHLARGQRKARRIAPEDWLATPIRLPDRSEQNRTIEILDIAAADLKETGQLIEALTRQKRGLMQKLLTGEWRVNPEGTGG